MGEKGGLLGESRLGKATGGLNGPGAAWENVRDGQGLGPSEGREGWETVLREGSRAGEGGAGREVGSTATSQRMGEKQEEATG